MHVCVCARAGELRINPLTESSISAGEYMNVDVNTIKAPRSPRSCHNPLPAVHDSCHGSARVVWSIMKHSQPCLWLSKRATGQLPVYYSSPAGVHPPWGWDHDPDSWRISLARRYAELLFYSLKNPLLRNLFVESDVARWWTEMKAAEMRHNAETRYWCMWDRDGGIKAEDGGGRYSGAQKNWDI